MDCGIEDQLALFSEYQDRGIQVFVNAWKNSEQFSHSCSGLSLQGSCKGKVALVCGAGVSLEGILPLLSSLEDKVLFIAGGSAITALQREGISPHLMTGVDPSPSWDRFLEQLGSMAPFVYQARFSADQLSLFPGLKVWMPGAGSCRLDSHLLLQDKRFDAGWSVANFSVALATSLGCSRIILAGMDFCAPQKKIYAGSLRFSPQEALCIPIPGSSLYTRRDWVLSRDWLIKWIEEHPDVNWERTDTLDSQLAKSVNQVSIEELGSLSSSDLKGEIHALLQEASPLGVTKKEIQEGKKNVKESFEKALSLCNQMLFIWEKTHPNLPFDQAGYMICNLDLQAELAYQEILFPLWQVWQIPLLRKEMHEAGKRLHELLFFKTTLEIYLAEMT